MLERIRKTLSRLPHWAGIARQRTQAAVAWTVRTARDPKARDRAYCAAAFSAIFAFGAVSTDYLITGGPSWNPGAWDLPRERQYERVEFATPTALADLQLPEREVVEEATPVSFYDPRISADDLLGAPRAVFAAYQRSDDEPKPGFSTIADMEPRKPRLSAS